jgi:glycosyltransferase involved in cell wall biosynthesis
VLWAVPARGRALVRELKMLSRMEAASVGSTPEQLMAGVPDGALVSAGHLLTAQTIAALTAVDLSQRPLPGDGVRRVLLLGRDGVDPDERLTQTLDEAGIDVATLPGEGYGELLMQPSEARTPVVTIDLVNRWLDGATQSPVEPDGSEPSSDDRVAFVVDGEPIEERPFAVTAAGVPMLGILSVPGGDRPAADTCLVLLNPGALRRTGPNRVWLELARRWAARGLPVLRIDLARVGDLTPDPEDADRPGVYDLHAHYHPDLGPQLHEVLDALRDACGPTRFILGGLCSGSYWTFDAMRTDPSISAGLLVNTGALFDDGLVGLALEREALGNVRTLALWRKVLTGGVGIARVRQLAKVFAAGALSSARQRLRGGRAVPLAVALRSIHAADQRLEMVFSAHEPFYEALAAGGELAMLEADPNVEVMTLDDLPRGHTLEPLPLQQQIHHVLDAAIERELDRHAGAGEAAAGPPLRILHVTESLASGVLGVVSALTARLAADGHEVVVAYGERPETPVDAGSVIDPAVELVALPWRRRTVPEQLRAAWALRRLVQRTRPDVVHLHSTFAGAVGALAVPRSVPRIYSPHGYSFSRTSDNAPARALYRAFEWAIARRVDLVGAVSRSEAAQAVADVHAPRVAVVANGLPELDADRLPEVPQRPVARIVALSRIGPSRQPEQSARILSAAAAASSAEVLWIGGGGGDQAGPGLEALRRHGVPVTGWLPVEAARRELAQATAMLHWSAWDAQPLAVLEAMARDVVVVASDLAANRELLGDGQVCATEDEAVALLRAILEDPDVRERLLASQRRRREHYGADRMTSDWLAVYRGLAAVRTTRIPA